MKRYAAGLAIGLILSFIIGTGIWAMSVGIDFKTGPSDSAISRFCDYLYTSSVGQGIRESVWVFPIIEGTHLLGIALSVGVLCWFEIGEPRTTNSKCMAIGTLALHVLAIQPDLALYRGILNATSKPHGTTAPEIRLGSRDA